MRNCPLPPTVCGALAKARVVVPRVAAALFPSFACSLLRLSINEQRPGDKAGPRCEMKRQAERRAKTRRAQESIAGRVSPTIGSQLQYNWNKNNTLVTECGFSLLCITRSSNRESLRVESSSQNSTITNYVSKGASVLVQMRTSVP